MMYYAIVINWSLCTGTEIIYPDIVRAFLALTKNTKANLVLFNLPSDNVSLLGLYFLYCLERTVSYIF